MQRFLAAGVIAASSLVAGAVVVPAVAAPLPPPISVRATVSPKHISRPPYTYTITGRIVPPQICQRGQTGPKYCQAAPCTGTVKVVITRSGFSNVLASGTASVDPTTCTYAVVETIPKRKLTTRHKHWVWLAVVATYSGNSEVASASARTHYVRARTVSKHHHHHHRK
jgi:hypothetical protein